MRYDATSTPLRPVAHWTHTLALVVVLVIISMLGRYRASLPLDSTSHAVRYVSSVTMEWLLLGAVIAGLYDRRAFLTTALPQRAPSLLTTFMVGIAIYCVGFFAIASVSSALYFTPLFHRRNEAFILAMMPQTAFEFIVWVAVSFTAGVCEELVFRGYLLQQLSAWLNNPVAAIVAVGAVFGGVHIYEGVSAILPLTALAILYGFVVRRLKGDLRAVIIAHTLQDILVAFLVLARPFAERHHPHVT